jgi:hypothetical protein
MDNTSAAHTNIFPYDDMLPPPPSTSNEHFILSLVPHGEQISMVRAIPRHPNRDVTPGPW